MRDGEADLLDRAKVEPDKRDEALMVLRTAMRLVSVPKRATPRPSPGQANDKLDRIQKLAKQLGREILGLRRSPHSHLDFWLNDAFGPIYMNEMERAGVLDTIAAVETAAKAGRNDMRSRPVNHRKQRIVDAACSFYARYSPRRPSTTELGGFKEFARAFHSEATGRDESVERQVLKAVKKFRGKEPLTKAFSKNETSVPI